MLDRISDTDQPATTIVLHGTIADRPYEAQIRVTTLDQLAELALHRPGLAACQGPIRVQILSAGAVR